MIHHRDNKDTEDFISEVGQARLALWVVVLVVAGYLVLAWLTARLMGTEPLLDRRYSFHVYAACCAIGLAGVLYSFHLARPGAGARFLIALGLAELPAFLGLIHFVLYRERPGFGILLGATALAFIVHSWRAKPSVARPSS